ncbi:MAG: alpha/beta hydrolase [Desulfobulbaceae bacterium]|nr:alpha/beta hydrolase [Desulfobulbaceae bacterium]
MRKKKVQRKMFVSTLFSALGIFLAVYIVVGAFLYLNQHRLIYYPMSEIVATPDRIDIDYQNVRFRTSDDLELAGWFIPGDKEGKVVLFCHGNAGNISHRLDTIKIFHEFGLGVFIFDYRGYGESEGLPSEQGTYLDGGAAWEYLTGELGVPASKVVVFGRSLGGAVAARLSVEENPIACILESTFTSLPKLAASFYPIYPNEFLCHIRYETLSLVTSISCPLLIIHSRDDEIIPFEHGQDIFQALGGQGEFLEIFGDHNNGFIISGDLYKEGLLYFIRGSDDFSLK